MGKVIAVCISKEKGTQKYRIPEGEFIEEWGLRDDAHAGKWHRQVSLLSYDKIQEFRARGAEDCTALVAFLSDLRHLKNHIVAAESGSYRKVCKIKTFHYQIFPKGSILNFRTSCTKLLDLIIR